MTSWIRQKPNPCHHPCTGIPPSHNGTLSSRPRHRALAAAVRPARGGRRIASGQCRTNVRALRAVCGLFCRRRLGAGIFEDVVLAFAEFWPLVPRIMVVAHGRICFPGASFFDPALVVLAALVGAEGYPVTLSFAWVWVVDQDGSAIIIFGKFDVLSPAGGQEECEEDGEEGEAGDEAGEHVFHVVSFLEIGHGRAVKKS